MLKAQLGDSSPGELKVHATFQRPLELSEVMSKAQQMLDIQAEWMHRWLKQDDESGVSPREGRDLEREAATYIYHADAYFWALPESDDYMIRIRAAVADELGHMELLGLVTREGMIQWVMTEVDTSWQFIWNEGIHIGGPVVGKRY